jgi:hypothetical protein
MAQRAPPRRARPRDGHHAASPRRSHAPPVAPGSHDLLAAGDEESSDDDDEPEPIPSPTQLDDNAVLDYPGAHDKTAAEARSPLAELPGNRLG